MLSNYLTIAARQLLKNKAYSLVNVLGLTIGLACCILIVLYAQHELSYDRYHAKTEHLYRVAAPTSAALTTGIAPFLEAQMPGVKKAARIKMPWGPVMSYKDRRFYEKVYFADPTFFELFDFHFVRGDAHTALVAPRSIVLTREKADKLFDTEDPLGKTILWDNEFEFKVTGVVEMPQNTHFNFDFVGSFSTLDNRPFGYDKDYWSPTGTGEIFTYVLFEGGYNPESFSQTFMRLIESHKGKEYVDGLRENDAVPFLQPLTDIHLHSHLPNEMQPNGDIDYVYLMAVIAACILLVAVVNFVNLSTAQASKRGKEVGVRKALGAYRMQLLPQFLGESFMLCAAALVLALGTVALVLPTFGAFVGKDLTPAVDARVIAALLALLVGVIAAAGLYPALVLSAFRPAAALKERGRGGSKGHALRTALVVFQFVVASLLIFTTYVVHNQLRAMQDKNLGLNKDQVYIFYTAYFNVAPKVPAIMDALRGHAEIAGVSAFDFVPFNRLQNQLDPVEIHTQEGEKVLARVSSTDGRFAELFGIELAAGRYLSDELKTDDENAVVNEAMARALGAATPTDAVGQYLRIGGGKMQIVGVVRDFHYEAMHRAIAPLVIETANLDWPLALGVRINPQQVDKALPLIEKTWDDFVVGMPFGGWFLSEDFAALFRREQRLSSILLGFSGLAIFIGCMGTFALAAFIAQERTKEIGIRKALGASVEHIALLLARDFVKIVAGANIIAGPLAYYIAHQWLSRYAYRIDLGIGIFALVCALTLAIVLLAISVQTLRAAFTKPVDALRYE